MLRAIMQSVLRWFTWGIGHIGHSGRARAVRDNDSAFEHVDSARLAASDFRASASIGLGAPASRDFAETMPAYALSLPRPRTRRTAMTFGA